MKLKVISILALIAVVVVSLAALSSCSLSGNGNLKISVQDDFHDAVIGAKVVSRNHPSELLRDGITNRDGVVVFNNIEAGTYDIEVIGAGFASSSFSVMVKSGETRVAVVILRSDYVTTTP